MNGASDPFVEFFGEASRHRRSDPGIAVLPRDTVVIVDRVIEISEP